MGKIVGYACKGKGEALELWSYDSHPMGPNDVHIKITHCGICHSDIHTLDSGWGPTTYPVIVGHEIVGIVTDVGPAVKKFKIGDRVGVGAQCSSCHDCKECKVGNENLCGSGVFTYNATYPDGKVAYGGYAEAVIVPDAFTFLVPDAISSAEAAPLFCAGVTVFTPLKKHMTPGCRVGVVGIGGLGHLGIQFAKALGALEVVAITSSLRKKDDALKLGAARVLNSSDPQDMQNHMRSLDVILCTVSSHDIQWESYISCLKTGGKFIVVGVPEESISLNLAALIFAQASIVGSLIGSPSDIEQMLECAAIHNVKPWIQKAPMSQVNEALTNVRSNNVRFRYVLEN